MKIIFHYFLTIILILIGLSIFSRVSATQSPSAVILADGGYIDQSFVPDPDPFKYLIFELQGKNIPKDTWIRGKITHPYGSGAFDLVSSPVVQDVSVSTFTDTIHFELLINTEIPDQLTRFFFVKPITQSKTSLGRPGNRFMKNYGYDFQQYPFRIDWIEYVIQDAKGNRIPAECKTDPVLIYSDVESTLNIISQSFPEDIVFFGLSALNGVELYPPLEINRNPFWISIERITEFPLTFSVRLKNGSFFLITKPFAVPIILEPPSQIREWESYIR